MNDPLTEVRLELSPRRIRVIFENETVADSTRAQLVWRPGWPPVPWYYFPLEDVKRELLVDSAHTEDHPSVGTARYWSLRVGDRTAERAVIGYPESDHAELRNLVTFNWGAMDAWFEEDEEIYVHPRDPHKRIDVLHSSRHVEVFVEGTKVADSHRPVLLFESDMPTRYYLHKPDVRMDLLESSARSSECPYKGKARYWSVKVGDRVIDDLAWGYETPLLAVAKITGLVCFYNEKLDIVVDGVSQERPVTGFSKKR